MLFKDSQWFSELQQQLMSNAALEGHFIIFILGLPFETWLWQMLSHSCIRMNVRKMHTTKTDCGTIYSEAQMRTSPHEYGWWTSLMMPTHFLSWSDLTSWEESMEKNIELTTMSPFYCKVWDPCLDDLTVPKRLVITYTWKVLFQLEASSWLINNLDGLAWCTQPIRG